MEWCKVSITKQMVKELNIIDVVGVVITLTNFEVCIVFLILLPPPSILLDKVSTKQNDVYIKMYILLQYT